MGRGGSYICGCFMVTGQVSWPTRLTSVKCWCVYTYILCILEGFLHLLVCDGNSKISHEYLYIYTVCYGGILTYVSV